MGEALMQKPPVARFPGNRFPLKEMATRGWISGSIQREPERLLASFFSQIGSPMEISALLKRTETTRFARSLDPYALAAWKARIVNRASDQRPKATYKPNSVNLQFMREVA
jgi:HTH-type transcriptional regulator/antitoxin HigA